MRLQSFRKIVYIIHDLNELRWGNSSGKEVKNFENAYGVISHNQKMTEFLVENGVKKDKIINLNIFDYLIKVNNKGLHINDDDFICFAGNLAKSSFIYNISETITDLGVGIYGINYENSKNDRLHYYGSFDSEIIHTKIAGKYGLIWDGESTDTCNGFYGNYMKYNNPHKVSMYIAANMPIIIWEKAALSNFVKEQGIGYTINKIDDIYKIYSEFDEEKYIEMCNKVNQIKKQITNGDMLERALNTLLEK